MTDENTSSGPAAPETAVPVELPIGGAGYIGGVFGPIPPERLRELLTEHFDTIRQALERAGLPITPDFCRLGLESVSRVEFVEQQRRLRENPPVIVGERPYPPAPVPIAPRKGDPSPEASSSSDEASSEADNVIPLRLSKGAGNDRLRELAVRLAMGERLDARERAMVREYLHTWADEITR